MLFRSADIAYCLRVLTDYLDLLHDWQERYKPASPEEPLDERFVEALHTTETIEHLTDCVAFGTPQQKAAAAAQLLSGSYLLMLEERTGRLALAKCAQPPCNALKHGIIICIESASCMLHRRRAFYDFTNRFPHRDRKSTRLNSSH